MSLHQATLGHIGLWRTNAGSKYIFSSEGKRDQRSTRRFTTKEIVLVIELQSTLPLRHVLILTSHLAVRSHMSAAKQISVGSSFF